MVKRFLNKNKICKLNKSWFNLRFNKNYRVIINLIYLLKIMLEVFSLKDYQLDLENLLLLILK